MKRQAGRWSSLNLLVSLGIVALALAACDDPSGKTNNVNNVNNVNNISNVNNQTGVCGAAAGQLFNADHPWNQRVDSAALDAESEAIINYLQGNHASSWAEFKIDGPSDEPGNLYGITILRADGSEVTPFVPTDDHWSPDCDTSPVPLPADGAIEGETGYTCDNDGDCHLIVLDATTCRLYEMWRANVDGGTFYGGCLSVWDLNQAYTPTLRGECCTSADAAGLPIAAHMFGPDDITAGEITHALRFILPNENMRERIYVRPATHSTQSTSAGADAPPYGARLRLRADFDLTSLNPAAQVVAVALQRYGMILSDGGNLTFTALNEAEVGLGPNDLMGLEWTDFEVVELGERFVWDDNCNCERTPLTN